MKMSAGIVDGQVVISETGLVVPEISRLELLCD
jgi:hypothetical protein